MSTIIKVRRFTTIPYFYGLIDGKGGAVEVDENGNCVSHYLEATSAHCNAAISVTCRDAEDKITEINKQIWTRKHRVNLLKLRLEDDSEQNSCYIERNKARITKLEREIISCKAEKKKLIKKTCEEIKAIRWLYEARETEPYLRGVSKNMPGVSYKIPIENQPLYCRFIERVNEEN